MPKVSVLTPIYNTNTIYLTEMIESILNQTFKDFEFIILNDSPENDVIEKMVLSYKDPRIIYMKNAKNIGISNSRNKLLENAKGEYVAIFDHDDISMPNRLEEQVKILDNNPDIGAVSSNIKIYNQNKITNYPTKNQDIKASLVNRGCVFCHPASMLRKSVLIENNIKWEEKYSPCEDYMLWAKLIDVTMFSNIKEPLIQYRDHKNNTSHLQKEKMDDKTALIKNFLINKYPHYLNTTVEYKLFGHITILKIQRYGNKHIYKLFGILPLMRKRYI